MSEFSDRLAAAQAAYDDVGDGPDGPPKGQYQLRLVDANLKETDDGRIFIIWEWMIQEGEQKGEQFTDFSSLTSEKRFPIKRLRQRIARLGYDVPTDLREYENLVPTIAQAAPIVVGKIKYGGENGDLLNMSITQLIQQRSTGSRPAPQHGAQSGTAITPDPATAAQGAEPASASDTDLVADAEYTFADDEGNELTGTFQGSFDGDGDAHVMVDDQLYAVPPASLTPVAGGEPAEDAQAGDMTDELIGVAQAYGLKPPADADQSAMISFLSEYTWKRAELTDEEAEVLIAAGVAVAEEAPKPKPKPAPKPKAARKPAKAKAGKKPKARAGAKPKGGKKPGKR